MAIESYDVVIVGAGGAGMMCAIWAGRRGRRVLVLDHASKIGRKILISGGGRCNFTNVNCDPSAFVSTNPHFCKSALARFKPDDFIAMVKSHRIAFHEKKLGQLFCDGSAQSIVDLLVAECQKANVTFKIACGIKSIQRQEGFLIDTDLGTFRCGSLVIATGGLSIPQIGATGFGYDLARQFGLAIVPTAPALDGFNFTKADLEHFGDLAGVSIDTVVTCNKASFRENILFTHNGLSGPASLQASLYWTKGDPVTIDLLPDLDAYQSLSEKRADGVRAELKNVLAECLPKRFAEKYCHINHINAPLVAIKDERLKQISSFLHEWKLHPASTVGYKKAEVTRGGVDTRELSSTTMESKTVPGLYFIGEVVDVTGQLGGYNFQWAWSSGFAAGQAC